MKTVIAPEDIWQRARVAYDEIAPCYDESFPFNEVVGFLHDRVRRRLLDVFPGRGYLLEVGGGTGRDALWLAERGFRLLEADISPVMLNVVQSRLQRAGFSAQLETRHVKASDLHRLIEEKGIQVFDGACSFYGAANSEPDMAAFSRHLAGLLKPGAYFVSTVFNRFCLADILLFLATCQPKKAFERWHPWFRGRLASKVQEPLYARAYTPRQFFNYFRPYFRLRRVEGLGVIFPPSLNFWYSRRPRLAAWAKKWEPWVARRLPSWGNDFVMEMERLP